MQQPALNQSLQPGHRLSHALVIERLLGRGGMGTVYLAHDELLDRRVAVKLLDGVVDVETAALKTLLEARAAARVVHPHVVAVHQIGDVDGVPFIEMEFVDGQSLRQRLRGPAPGRGLLGTWLAQVAAALTTAHEAGVVHCDVKPENVMIRQRGETAKLADFGLARSQKDGSAHTPLSHGTLAYLAPELQNGPPTPASDQFALAVVAVEMWCGQRPERASPRAPVQLPPALAIPPKAEEVLLRALAREPEARFPSAATFVDALLRALGLANLRGPLVGMSDVEAHDASKTSSELPVPVLSVALHPLDMADQVLAVLAVLPSGYPGALREALGTAPPPDVLAGLRRAGRIDGLHEDWRWVDPQPRETALRRLAPRQRRQVCARVAAAIEVCGQKRESTREDATRLYLAARRLRDAARLAMESAATAKSAQSRDHHLARAVALLTSQTEPEPWLAALLVRIEWLLACGWAAAARGPVAEAQGVMADAGLAADHPLRLRLNGAAARLRTATGDPLGAAEGLSRLIQQVATVAAPVKLQLVAALAAAHLAAGQPAKAWAVIADALAQPLPPAGTALDVAMTELRLTAAEALLSLGHLAEAAQQATQALASAEESGDAIAAARAQLALADLARAQEAPERHQRLLARTANLLDGLGATEISGVLHLRQAELLARTGRAAAALGHLERATAGFELLGLARHDAEAHRLRQVITAQLQ